MRQKKAGGAAVAAAHAPEITTFCTHNILPGGHPAQAESEKSFAPAGPSSEIITADELAEITKTTRRQILDNTRKGLIPVLRINPRVLRYHRPTVLAYWSRGS